MKKGFFLIIFVFFILEYNLYAETIVKQIKILPKGESVLEYHSDKIKIEIKIGTHEKDIGKPTDPTPKVNRTACTYTKYPCRLVDYML